ncbi:hypothetical protein [Burkholderia sp. BCC1644]|uniref:hypothetical protein n=1 Tax=Burkholderia sp. BCC1644 TaxID=2676293 RepID=UPI001FC85505|nr:hypothetical protein [Burkholderia sp. BCC1644]
MQARQSRRASCLGIAVPGTLFAAARGGAAGSRAARFVGAAIQLTGAVVSAISVRQAA